LGPAGGIDANVDEMARYALLQLGDGTTSAHRLVSAQMMAELHRPEITVGTDWSTAAHIQNLHYAGGSPLMCAACTSFIIMARIPVSALRSSWFHPPRQAWSS
jgi:CubicO group peptidase (beta-lactamase class C family)